jgi:hypothetical protein
MVRPVALVVQPEMVVMEVVLRVPLAVVVAVAGAVTEPTVTGLTTTEHLLSMEVRVVLMITKELQMVVLEALLQAEITQVAVAVVIQEVVVALYRLAVAVTRRLEVVAGPTRQSALLLRTSQILEMGIFQLV